MGMYASEASDVHITRQLIAQLVPQLPRRVRVWLGGNGAQRLGSLPDDTERFESYEEFDRVVNALVREHRKIASHCSLHVETCIRNGQSINVEGQGMM